MAVAKSTYIPSVCVITSLYPEGIDTRKPSAVIQKTEDQSGRTYDN